MARKTYLILGLMVVFVSEAFAGVRFVGSTYTGGPGNVREFGHIEIAGEITDKDLEKLPSAIRQFEQQQSSKWSNLLVYLNSTGGDVWSAIEIGKVLRSHSAAVYVDEGAECSSACVFILAGGVSRRVILGASIGLHRPFFEKKLFAELDANEASELYNSLISICRDYLSEMGINDALFSDMLVIPSHEVRYVDTYYAGNVGLHGDDAAYQEWERARTEQQIGKDKLRLRDLYIDCVNSGIEDAICGNRFGAGFQ